MADNIPSSDDECEIDEDLTGTFDFTKKNWRDDVAFLVEGERLYAAKSILALVSPVFESMFGSQFAEKYQHEVELPGKKFEDFHEFLKCVYPTSRRLVTENSVTKLLPLADEYQVKSLIKRCSKFLGSYLLSKDGLTTAYLMSCHELSTRFRLHGVKDVCVRILAEKDQKEIIEAKSVFQDPDSFLQLQNDIIIKQGADREKLRTEVVKLYMNIDITRNTFTSDIIGFDYAKGATIEFKPSLTTLLQKQLQLSDPVRLWDLFFQLQVTHYLKHDGDQCMKLRMRCTFPDDGMAWVCETKSKICIKNQNETPSAINICHLLNGYFLTKERPVATYVQNLAPILKSESGYIKKDKLDLSLHFLANKPYYDQVSPPQGNTS